MIANGAIAAGAIADSPTAVSGKVDYTLTCAAGSYSYAGTVTTLKRSVKLSLAVGTYTYAGTATTLKLAVKLPLAVGTYSYAGTTTALARAVKLPLAVGAYSYVGTTTVLNRTVKLPLAAGTYSLTGNVATLIYTPGASPTVYALLCDTGTYGLTGNDAELTFVSGVRPSGGFFAYPTYAQRFPASVKKAREKLRGVETFSIDEAAAINQVATELIDQAAETREIDIKGWVAKLSQNEQRRQAVQSSIESNGYVWDDSYLSIIQLAVDELLQREEEIAILLLMSEL